MELLSSMENIHNGVEKELLKQFRKNLADVIRPNDTDAVLLKWLRAKNFNLKRSEILYRENISARKLHRVDEITDIWVNPEVIEKYQFANLLCIAKDGTPVHYIAMGRGDYKGFLMSLDHYDIGRYCSYAIELGMNACKEQSEKLGKEINSIIYVADMEEFTLQKFLCQAVIDSSLDLFKMLQDHYPESWKKILVVNAPVYFHTAFNLIRPILRNTFLKNFYVVSKDDTAKVLLKYIDADVLPVFLGGKRVDSNGDPMCSEFVKFGGMVPEKYYLRDIRPPLLATDEGAESVWIYPRCCFNYPIVVREVGSKISIEIRTERGSIYGTILFRKFGVDPEFPDIPSMTEYLDPHDEKCNVELISPAVHFLTHLTPIQTFIIAPWPGIYIFQFDNTGNWLTSRNLIYRFQLLPPSA